MADLTKEIETYNAKLPFWTEHEGEFVLIHEDTVDFFRTYEEALSAGYERFGIAPFLVKQVLRVEKTHFVSRLAVPQTT